MLTAAAHSRFRQRARVGLALAIGALAAGFLPASASAAVTCSHAAGQMNVQLDADGDQVSLSQNAIADGGQLYVDGNVCLGAGDVAATGENIDTIRVFEAGADLRTTVRIFLEGGGFTPGDTEELAGSEIEIEVDTLTAADSDALFLDGTGGDDNWRLGTDGINFNSAVIGDADADIVYPPGGEAFIAGNQFATGLGNDVLDARGDDGTGLQSNLPLRVFGQEGDDELIGGDAIDGLSGDAGADIIRGRGATDQFNGGTGNDTLDGVTDAGGIPDALNYGFAPSGVSVDLSQIPGTLDTGSEGVDTIAGSFPQLNGSPHADTLKGGPGPGITIRGQAGNDLIEGGTGNENLRGGPGSDLIRGGPGNDSLWGSETFPADPGVDTVAYDTAPAGVNVDLDADSADGGAGSDGIAFVENVIGSPFADTIRGDAAANVLTGGGGPDQVFGREGADTLLLRDGLGDTGDCGADGDTAVVDAAGLDTLIGCEGVDDGTSPASGTPTAPSTGALDPQCGTLRAKLKKAKKKLKAAKRADKPTKKKRKKVRKLRRELRELGC